MASVDQDLDVVDALIASGRTELNHARLIEAALMLGACRARACYDRHITRVVTAERRLWSAHAALSGGGVPIDRADTTETAPATRRR